MSSWSRISAAPVTVSGRTGLSSNRLQDFTKNDDIFQRKFIYFMQNFPIQLPPSLKDISLLAPGGPAPTAWTSTCGWWTTSACPREEGPDTCASARRTTATQLIATSTVWSSSLYYSQSSHRSSQDWGYDLFLLTK